MPQYPRKAKLISQRRQCYRLLVCMGRRLFGNRPSAGAQPLQRGWNGNHRRIVGTFAVLLGLVAARPGGAGAQERIEKPVMTKTPLPPPPQVSSASPGTVSPGTVVTLTGTNIGGVTEVVLVPGEMDF